MVRRSLGCLPPLLALLMAAPPEAGAQVQNRRLVLEVELQRQGPVQSGAERGSQKLQQRWQLSALLQSDGTRHPYNPLDPQDQRRQLEQAQKATARMAPMSAAAPDARALQALQANAQALMTRCGQDSACLMREAAALNAPAVARGDPAVRARLQAYGQAAAACERQAAGRAREACQADARRQAGGGVDDTRDEELPTPYLVFNGVPACGLQMQGRIEERVDGSFGDVQGQVPYAETTRGEEARRDDTPCPTLQAVLDTRSGRVWTALSLVPQQVRGVHTRQEGGRQPQRSEGDQALRWHEAQAWLQQGLLRLSDQGRDEARFPLPGGQTEIRMRWSFRPA